MIKEYTKEEVIKKLNEDPRFIKKVKEWQNDQDIIQLVLKLDGSLLNYLPDEVKLNIEYIQMAIDGDEEVYASLSTKIRKNKDITLFTVRKYGYLLEYASDELRNDKEVVMAAVQQSGYALSYASRRLRMDTEVIKAAAAQDSTSLQFSLCDKHKTFQQLIDQYGDEFMFSCARNVKHKMRAKVAAMKKFKPSKDIFELGMQDESEEVKLIYLSRMEEWNLKTNHHYTKM